MGRLAEVVHKDARHVWYTRTTELASLYRKLVTGDDLDSLLQQFVQREDEASFKQRVRLTQHVVTTVVENIMDVFYKVPRSNYQRIVEHNGKSDDPQTVQLEGLADEFWGEKSLDAYMKTRWLEMNADDPNAFCVVEFGDFDNTKERAQSYPFEVTSAQAVDYKYQNNVLQYLIVETEFPLPLENRPNHVGKKYTVYLKDQSITLIEIDPKNRLPALDGEYTQQGDNTAVFRSKDRLFLLEILKPHNAGWVPAKQVGYARDAWTKGQTFVSPYNAAVPILLKSIKVNSELDITMSQQVFPHRLQYMPKCQADGCLDGHLANGQVCSSCKGSGHASISSAQEVMYFTMPHKDDELIDLEKILVFKGPPIGVVKFQADYVDKLTAAAKAFVFNSESFTQAQIQGTATGQILDRDNIQDTLFTCSDGFAEMWSFLMYTTANFADLDKGLDARLIFSKDFKLKGLTELVADLESAKRSNAGPAVIMHIQEQIARLIYSDQPDMFREWSVKERFNPFSGFSEEQIAMALASPQVPARIKARFYMSGLLFSDIETEAPGFYSLATAKQKELVEAKIQQYMDEAGANAPPAIRIPEVANAN